MGNKNKTSVVMKWYRIERFCYEHHLKFIANLIYHFIQIIFGCTIPYSAVFEKGVNFAHFHGIVINQKTFIKTGTLIYQNVTIGGTKKGSPIIGKNCIIGSGAVILGNVTLGDNVKIGANAVVLKDVPSNCTAVGIPAKVITSKKLN